MALSRQIHNRGRVRRRGSKRKLWPIYAVALGIFILGIGWYALNSQGDFKKKYTNVAEDVVETVTQTKKPIITVAETQTKIDTYLASQAGTFGYTAIDLSSGETFGKNEDVSFLAASTVKVAFATYALHRVDEGGLKLSDKWTYTSADYEGGTGTLIGYDYGTKLSVSKMLELMIEESDNAASNVTLRYNGRGNIQAYLDQNGITGFNLTKNLATPLLTKIYDGELLSNSSKDLLIGFMKNSMLPDRIVAGVPDGIPVAHKIGTQVAAISDVAIVYHPKTPYIIVIYSKEVIGETKPNLAIKEISKIVYEHYDSK
jgi:beta-lactamase class A